MPIWQSRASAPPIRASSVPIVHLLLLMMESLPSPVDWEVTRGAFTVANKNDTNGDGTPDNAQGIVLATALGTDEVDLMRLELYKPRGYVTGTSAWLSIDSGTVAIWDNSTKDNLLPIAESGGGVAVFWTGENPIVWWVEALDTSTAVRDIQLTLTYDGASDAVKATGVWAEFSQAFHDTQSAELVVAALTDPTTQEHDLPPATLERLEYFGGTGLRPYNVSKIPPIANGILIQFDVAPQGLDSEPVNVDIARRVVGWGGTTFTNGTHQITQVSTEGLMADQANDDANQFGESAWEVTAQDHAYSWDAPGPRRAPIAGDNLYRLYANFWEYIRIGFENTKPQGNTLSGSRASAFWPWHVSHTLQSIGGEWIRTTGDTPEVQGENDVAPDHISLPQPPQ